MLDTLALNLTAMSEIQVVFTRNGETASLELHPPDAVQRVYEIWWMHCTNDQRLLDLGASEKRMTRKFYRRCDRLIRDGWTPRGGEHESDA